MTSRSIQYPVSTVIPCFNSGRFLLEAVGSARAAGSGQIVVVDDGSNDTATIQQLESLASSDGRGNPVTVLRLGTNGGHLHAIAAALEAVTLPLVALLDADDRMAPGWLTTVAAEFDRHHEVVQISGRSRLIDAEGRPIAGRTGWLRHLPSIQPRLDSGDVTNLLLAHNWYHVSTTAGLAYRTETLRELCRHLPEERAWFDTWSTAAAPFLGDVLGLDTVAFDYRLHDHNVLGGTDDLDLFMTSRRNRARWVSEWAARTGRPSPAGPSADGRLVVERFAAGEDVSRTERLRAVRGALTEARSQPLPSGAAMVTERVLRSLSPSLGRRIASHGLGRALLDLRPRRRPLRQG